MEKKIPFAPVVMLIDASYLDRVGSDMSAHFAPIVNRELPKADLANLLECLALDAGCVGGTVLREAGRKISARSVEGE